MNVFYEKALQLRNFALVSISHKNKLKRMNYSVSSQTAHVDGAEGVLFDVQAGAAEEK